MPSSPPKAASSGAAEVRYSLPELLRDIQIERDAPAFAMERLDQADITRVFGKKPRTRRVLKPRQ